MGWLAVGAIAGLVIATAGLLRSGAVPPGDELPTGVVARVNQAHIGAADFERLIAALDSETRSNSDAQTRKRVLDRMIDEELLVQRGLELGLAARDRQVRGDLTSAVIRSVVVEAEQREPSRDELEAFFADHIAFFTQPGRLRVEQIFFRVRTLAEDPAAKDRADETRQRLREGADFALLRAEVGDDPISNIPDALLPATKLREYIGPAALQAITEVDAGAVSEPVRSGIGYHILRVNERETPRAPGFDAFEPQIRAEWRRRTGDAALRAYLDELRSRAVVVAPVSP